MKVLKAIVIIILIIAGIVCFYSGTQAQKTKIAVYNNLFLITGLIFMAGIALSSKLLFQEKMTLIEYFIVIDISLIIIALHIGWRATL